MRPDCDVAGEMKLTMMVTAHQIHRCCRRIAATTLGSQCECAGCDSQEAREPVWERWMRNGSCGAVEAEQLLLGTGGPSRAEIWRVKGELGLAEPVSSRYQDYLPHLWLPHQPLPAPVQWMVPSSRAGLEILASVYLLRCRSLLPDKQIKRVSAYLQEVGGFQYSSSDRSGTSSFSI